MNGTIIMNDNLNGKMVKSLDDMMRCPICTEYFNNCVMTSCCHDFCSSCIKNRMATEVDCPICYEDLQESDLRINDSMDKIVRIYKKLTRPTIVFCNEILNSSIIPASSPPASFISESPLTGEEASARSPSASAQCTSCVKNEGFYSTILSELRELKEEMAMLRHDMNCVSKTMDFQLPDTQKLENVQLMEAGEIHVLEVELNNSEKFNKMVKSLGNFGGRDCNEVTRRILFALLSNKAACGFNWVGGYGKLGMKNFPRVLKMISVAVRQNPATKETKQADVETIVKRWLRTALDRCGGRNKRKNVE